VTPLNFVCNCRFSHLECALTFIADESATQEFLRSAQICARNSSRGGNADKTSTSLLSKFLLRLPARMHRSPPRGALAHENQVRQRGIRRIKIFLHRKPIQAPLQARQGAKTRESVPPIRFCDVFGTRA
jgi:hypothetical protein